MAMNTARRHADGSVETRSSSTDVLDMMLAFLDASTLLWKVLLSLILALLLAGVETTFEAAAMVSLLTITQNPDFDAHPINIHVESILCCQKIFGRKVKNHKHYCGVS